MARPREFDPEQAMEDVMNVFWRKGYEGTSLQDIEAAAGLNKQSLYRAFGDKRGMYLAALDTYEKTIIAGGAALVEQGGGSVYDRFHRLFAHAIEERTKNGDRRGCFLCNASVDQAALDAGTGEKVQGMLERIEAFYDKTLAAGPPFDADPDARRRMARALMAGYLGLRVLVKAGLPEAVLTEAMDTALAPLRAATV